MAVIPEIKPLNHRTIAVTITMEEASKILPAILVVIGDLKVPIEMLMDITGVQGIDLIVITDALRIVAGTIMNVSTDTGDTVVFDLIKKN
jgi:hypothetical protein